MAGQHHGSAVGDERRVARLSGYIRPVSDGSLYPAINRMLARGLLDRRVEPGAAAAQRYVLRLTDAGRAEEVADPYRHGMLLVARATSHAERGWLHQVLNDAAPDGANDTCLPDMLHAPGEPGG